jgi:hypothetical protein
MYTHKVYFTYIQFLIGSGFWLYMCDLQLVHTFLTWPNLIWKLKHVFDSTHRDRDPSNGPFGLIQFELGFVRCVESWKWGRSHATCNQTTQKGFKRCASCLGLQADMYPTPSFLQFIKFL